jgi:protein-S-isoprenylcysteine O-methyltransferase Ste14
MGDARSVPELLADLARSVPALVKQEAQLLKSELSDKVTQVEIGLGSVVAGAIMLFAALLVLLQAVVIALTELVGPGWASLIVGVAVAVIGAVLLKKGADQMKASSLMPERTAHQLKQDAELAKEQVR